MRVLILPAAGEGSRFAKAGFSDPKPFIRCEGDLMVRRAAAPFARVDRTLLILREEHRARWRQLRFELCMRDPELLVKAHEQAQNNTEGEIFDAHFISHSQEGAALSVLSALGQLSDEDAVIIANSDQFFEQPLDAWFDYLDKNPQLDGSILTFETEGGPWSYAEVNRHDKTLVTRIAEKEPISTTATCGVYYFRSWRMLRTAICKMVAANERYKGEFYLAPVYNQIIKDGGAVRTFDVADFKFYSVGTPELLRNWEARNGKLT